jgi:myo-inositol catabolism protein IolC
LQTEEQWQAILAAMQRESPRNRAMFALSYDAALRRQEIAFHRAQRLELTA